MRLARPAGIAVLLAGAACLAPALQAGTAGAQPAAPFSCFASVASPPTVPSEGESDLVGDIVLTCTGGEPTAAGQTVPQVDLTLFLDTPETSRLIAPPLSSPEPALSLTDAALVVDDPPAADQDPCTATTDGLPYVCQIDGTGGSGTYSGAAGHENVFYGYAGTPQSPTSADAVTWLGVPVDPPGAGGSLTLRLTNLRADASSLGVGPGGSGNVQAFLSISGQGPTLDNPSVIAAVVKPSLGVSLLDAAGTAPLGTPPAVGACGTATPVAVVEPLEEFAGAFETRTTAGTGTADQDVPGEAYGSESGFVDGSFPSPLSGAGLADSGTRLLYTFTGPAGSEVTLPTSAELEAAGADDGSLQMVTSATGPFSPVGGASATLTIGASPATAAYEVVSTTAGAVLDADLPVSVTAPAGTSPGPVSVAESYAPLETSAAELDASDGPIPRFVGGLPAQTVATVESCTFVSTGGTQQYGSSSPTFDYTTNPAGAPVGGTLACTTVDGGTPISASLPVGTYTLDAAGCSGLSAQGSVLDVAGAAGGFSVTPAPLTVTASSSSMTYGGAVPAITPSYAGFVAGDSAASLSTAPACGTTATSSSPVGTYTSSCSGAADPNYDISYLDGSVTVGPDATATAVTASADPVDSGAAVTFTATVTAAAPGSGTPTGEVVFALTGRDGTTLRSPCSGSTGSESLAGGVAACPVPSGVLLGSDAPYTVEVAYGGDPDFTASSGSTGEHVVDGEAHVAVSVVDATPEVGSGDTLVLVATAAPAGAEATSGPGRVVVTDELPPGLAYVASSPSSGTASAAGRTLTWILPDLGLGATATLRVRVSVGTTAVLRDTATFTQAVPTAAGATTGTADEVTVTPAYAVVSIHESVTQGTLAEGSADTFLETVASTGRDAALGVVVTSPVPAGLDVTAVHVSQGTAVVGVLDGVETITWHVGTVPVGATPTMQIEVTVVSAPGSLLDSATATETSYDPSGREHRSSAQVEVTAAPTVPPAHTGEPWSGWPYWLLVSLLGGGGVLVLGGGRRRRRPGREAGRA